MVQGRLRDAADVLLPADVRGDRDGPPAVPGDLVRQGAEGPVAAGRQDETRPLAGGRAGGDQPDAAGRAGEDQDLFAQSLQVHVHGLALVSFALPFNHKQGGKYCARGGLRSRPGLPQECQHLPVDPLGDVILDPVAGVRDPPEAQVGDPGL